MENYINETAQILGVNAKSVKNYTKVWGEMYNFDVTTPKEYADMIKDIVNFY